MLQEPEEGAEPVAINRAYNARYPMPQNPTPGTALPVTPNKGGGQRERKGYTNLFYAVALPGENMLVPFWLQKEGNSVCSIFTPAHMDCLASCE